MATIYLKHIHGFFNMCPLLKGVFMKMTMNLNNTTTSFECGYDDTLAPAPPFPFLSCTNISNSLGGVNPGMISALNSGSFNLLPPTGLATQFTKYKYNISVGSKCLDSSMQGVPTGNQSLSVFLYVPAYSFNPVFEQAYLSSPVKTIKYTDVYQYQVLGVKGGGNTNFNNLLTNGIADIKSVLILPFYSGSFGTTVAGTYSTGSTPIILSGNSGFLSGYPVFQSPFDCAGTGPTSPLALMKSFNVQISGQNAIYNMEKYSFEQFNNQLYGQNAINGGLTDGLTSGLINSLGFEMAYTYYYVNVERMLPVEMSVPKSVQITGIPCCEPAVDLYCFIEYGVNISLDVMTGARV